MSASNQRWSHASISRGGQSTAAFAKRHAGFIVLFATFVVIYGFAVHDAQVHIGGDTTAFEYVARNQLSWTTVFSTQRPPIYPALFRLLGFSRPAVAAVQFTAYVCAWTYLAATLWGRNLFVAASVFYVALYPGFAAWNHVLMSESLAISMTVVAIAFLLRFVAGAGWALWAFVAVVCLKCFLRGFDSILGLVYVPILLAAAIRHRMSWTAMAAAAAAFAFCVVFVNRTTGGLPDSVWHFAMVNNIGTRVLPDPNWLKYAVTHGMPLSDALLSMTGRLAHEENFRYFADPELAAFRDWVREHGRSTYSGYLLAHPLLIFSLLWQHRSEVFLASGFDLQIYFDTAYRFGIPPWPAFGAVYFCGSVGTLVLGGLLWLRRVPPQLVLPGWTAIILWLTLLPAALCIYHADAGEIMRHAIPLLLQAALADLLMLQIVCRWFETRHQAAAPTDDVR